MRQSPFGCSLLVLMFAALLVAGVCQSVRAEGPCTVGSGGDGDSFYVTCGTTVHEVRVLSIDTPEAFPWVDNKGVSRDPECWGKKAMNARKALTALGPVTLTGTATDGHGRWLRYVTLADGRDLGATLIAAGDAALFKGVDNGDPDYAAYAPLQLVAQAAPVGMWAVCGNPPGHNGRRVP